MKSCNMPEQTAYVYGTSSVYENDSEEKPNLYKAINGFISKPLSLGA